MSHLCSKILILLPVPVHEDFLDFLLSWLAVFGKFFFLCKSTVWIPLTFEPPEDLLTLFALLCSMCS